jgi:hypothetical protein
VLSFEEAGDSVVGHHGIASAALAEEGTAS